MTTIIPKSHPRAQSLLIREMLVTGFEKGLVAREGLLAHGRGEAFDYLMGEKTSRHAKSATRAAASRLLLAENPVISVNGNFAALCAKEIVSLAKMTDSKIEVNIFYTSKRRKQNIIKELKRNKAEQVLGNREKHTTRLSGLDSARRMVDADGIYTADVVLVPLEDGDRTQALIKAGKSVITFDLNPLSRTAQKSTVTIVDNVTRGMTELIEQVRKLSGYSEKKLEKIADDFDNKKNLAASIAEIKNNLTKRGRN